MAVQVTLEDHTGNTTREVKLEENVPISRLIPALIAALKWPITDNSGRPVTYHLSYNNRRLNGSETLTEAGVQTGETLTFLPEITAGTQYDSFAQETSYPFVKIESTAQKQPVHGFPSGALTGQLARSMHVTLHPQAMERIWSHATSYLQNEVGGLLIGKVYEENGQFLVRVEQSLEARYAIEELTFLTFTSSTWLDLLEQRRTYPDLITVGWYHSHPRMGIFFSMMDQFTHRHFFGNQPWYIALVVDPYDYTSGLFTWDKETIRTYPGS